jgi:hypothetical protein
MNKHFFLQAVLVGIISLKYVQPLDIYGLLKGVRTVGKHSLRNSVHVQNEFSSPGSAINFLFLGDWGYVGENQTLIATQMGYWAEEHHASFVVALGDNFYGKLLPRTGEFVSL